MGDATPSHTSHIPSSNDEKAAALEEAAELFRRMDLGVTGFIAGNDEKEEGR